MLNAITILLLVSASCFAITGEVELGGKDGRAITKKEASIKEITVTGIGTTLESAEKQALVSAVRQAVGAYIDSKTIVENEEVIQDRILSVSNAFVEKYKTIGKPKKSADGLIEITIIAMVKTNQVIQALKEQKIVTGEVAGQNLWAEVSTKVMNAQDAVTMLETKLPELIKNGVEIKFLTEEGKYTPNLTPQQIKPNSSGNSVTCIWVVELACSKKYYNESIFPLLKNCFHALIGSNFSLVKPKVTNSSGEGKMSGCLSYIGDGQMDWPVHHPFLLEWQNVSSVMPLKGYILCLNNSGNIREDQIIDCMVWSKPQSDGFYISLQKPISLQINFYDENGVRVSSVLRYLSDKEGSGMGVMEHPSPFIGPPIEDRDIKAGPYFIFDREISPTIRRSISVAMPLSELKSIKKIEFQLIPPEYKLNVK